MQGQLKKRQGRGKVKGANKGTKDKQRSHKKKATMKGKNITEHETTTWRGNLKERLDMEDEGGSGRARRGGKLERKEETCEGNWNVRKWSEKGKETRT